MSQEIFWGVENDAGDLRLHGFPNPSSRERWLNETMGLTAATYWGRSLPGQLPDRLNPLARNYPGPIIWH